MNAPVTKRKASSPAVTPQSPTKRARKTHRILDDTGRLSTAAILAEQSTSSASVYLSIRESAASTSDGFTNLQPGDRVPTLSNLCLKAIIQGFNQLFLDESGRVRSQDDDAKNAVAWLRLLSPKLCNRVLDGLLQNTFRQATTVQGFEDRPQRRITVSAITELFLKSKNLTSFTLPPDFFRAAQPQYDPGNRLEDDFDPENELAGPQLFFQKNVRSQSTAERALGRASRDRANLLVSLAQCTSLKSLNLSGQLKLQDSVAANLVKELPNLENVSFKGCTEVGDETVVQLARNAGLEGNLKMLNLNYTAVTVKGLKGLFARCKSLEVLKLASMNGLVDAAVVALLDPSKYIAQDWKVQPLAKLRSLKLRSTKIGDSGLKAILALCDSLSSLDISFTQVRSLDMLVNHLDANSSIAFDKLVLSGLALRSETILTKFFAKFAAISEDRRSRLKILKLGSLGLLDSQLMKIAPFMEKFERLEKISLHSNKTLATGTGSGIRRFLHGVGRKCRHLDLSYVPVSGRSLSEALLIDYESSGVDEFEASGLQVLLLDNTHVGDEIAVAISTLSNLEELHLEQAKITVEGMKTIMAGCPKLRIVNLTGCRGIPTRQRRDWFELYAKGEVGEED